jgi:Lecithin retinol acyltransferase
LCVGFIARAKRYRCNRSATGLSSVRHLRNRCFAPAKAAWGGRQTTTTDARTAMDAWPLGTHLTSPRRGYVHHGIYAGQGRVIHYAGFHRAFRRGPVEETSLEQFSRGRAVQATAASAAQFGGAEAVARARTRLGENRYRVWTNNCEHFVYWCLSGSSRSTQVERLSRRLRVLLAWRAPAGGRAMVA